MANCGCNDNSTPQPCCQDCPEANPCNSGCLDFIDASCVEYTSDLPSCMDIVSGSKLDFVIQAIDNELCDLQQRGDKFVRISTIDTNSGYLADKIITCDKLVSTIVSSGGQQKLQLCLADDAETPLTAVDSASIDFSTSGVADHTLTASISLSEDATNPLFVDSDGLSLDYTILVNTIVNNPTLMAALCTAISGC